jgi:hypothetical protein
MDGYSFHHKVSFLLHKRSLKETYSVVLNQHYLWDPTTARETRQSGKISKIVDNQSCNDNLRTKYVNITVVVVKKIKEIQEVTKFVDR